MTRTAISPRFATRTRISGTPSRPGGESVGTGPGNGGCREVHTLTEHTVAEAALAAGIAPPARHVAETGSTNADLLERAAAGAPAWSVLVAGAQTAGRGRLGRTWVSPPGASLLVSVLLRPALPPGEAPLLSIAAALAVAEAAREAAGVEVRCKWPNDLVVGERKVAGVLPEAVVAGGAVRHVVIGAGINVGQSRDDFPPELRGAATSLAMEGARADLGELLTAYLRGMLARAEPLRPPALLREYRERSATLGREVRALTVDGGEVQGLAVDVGPAGELVVRTAAGPEVVAFGEVAHLR